MTSLTWIITTDRTGRRAYVSRDGYIVSRDGVGSMPWTVLYSPDGYETGDYGMTDTMAEAKAWAEIAHQEPR